MRLQTLAGGLALAMSIVAPASAAAGEATDALRAFFAEGRRIILDAFEREDPEAGIAGARRLIHRAFDVRQAATRVLGREWDRRTPAEQDEFVRLFGDLMERAYLSHVIARLNSEDAIRVSYLDETRTGELAVVDTTVESRAGVIPFQYRMAKIDGRWTVRDVVVDGVSIVESYRAQLAHVLRRSSYAETIAALRERHAPADALAGSATAARPAPVAVTAVRAEAATPAPRTIAPPLAQDEPPRAPERPPARASDVGRAVPPAAHPAPAVAVAAREAPHASPRAAEAPPARATRVADPPRGTTTHAYWVQIGAFQDEARASRVIAQLGTAPVTITTAPDRLLRLRMGPFPDRAAASSAVRALQQRGFRPFVVETP